MVIVLHFSQFAHAFSYPKYHQSLIQSSCRILHPFTMHSSPVPIGKRPEFKQSRSTGWSWPRLVPIDEQQSRSSQASQSPTSPSLRDHNEQEKTPTTMISTIISKLHAEADAPVSPVLSAAGSSPTAGGSVAETVKHQPYELPRDSLSSMADSEDEERRVVGPDSGFVEDLAETKDPASERGSVEDLVETSALASERGPANDIAKPGDTENTSMCLPTKCDALSDCADQSIVMNS